MTRIVHKLLVVAMLILIGLTFVSNSAQAIDLFKTLCGNPGKVSGSTLCTDSSKGDKTPNPLVGPNGVIPKIVEVTAIASGIAAVFVLVYAGLTFIMANGEPGKIKLAEDMAKYAVYGMVAAGVAGSIVTYVLTKL
jgi:hypothetical protein